MRTKNLNLIMQKVSRVVHMMITHTNFHIFSYLKDEIKNKVALAVELSIYKSVVQGGINYTDVLE